MCSRQEVNRPVLQLFGMCGSIYDEFSHPTGMVDVVYTLLLTAESTELKIVATKEKKERGEKQKQKVCEGDGGHYWAYFTFLYTPCSAPGTV